MQQQYTPRTIANSITRIENLRENIARYCGKNSTRDFDSFPAAGAEIPPMNKKQPNDRLAASKSHKQ